jgi:hypothetical protein
MVWSKKISDCIYDFAGEVLHRVTTLENWEQTNDQLFCQLKAKHWVAADARGLFG